MREERQFAACEQIGQPARDPFAGALAIVDQAVFYRRFKALRVAERAYR